MLCISGARSDDALHMGDGVCVRSIWMCHCMWVSRSLFNVRYLKTNVLIVTNDATSSLNQSVPKWKFFNIAWVLILVVREMGWLQEYINAY